MNPPGAPIRHYIELRMGSSTFFLANTPLLVIEPRENMLVKPVGLAAAQRVVQGVAWPAFSLDADMEPVADAPWTRAIFLNTAEHGVGILVDDLRLVPVDHLRVEPFFPLGPLPPGGEPLFDAAAMETGTLTLVFSTRGLIAHLLYEERRHGHAQ